MKEFAERLRYIQRKRHITQGQLAQQLGIAQGTLSGYLSDKNNPQINDVAAFAQKLGVSIGWLCGEGDTEDNGYASIINAIDGLLKHEDTFSIEIMSDYRMPKSTHKAVYLHCKDKIIQTYCMRYDALHAAVKNGSLEQEEFDYLMKGKRDQILGESSK